MYLQTPSVQVIQLFNDGGSAIAKQVIRLLLTEDWVKCIGTAADTEIMWTVLNRTEDGYPVNIAYRDHYGNLGTIGLGHLLEKDGE